MHTDEQNMHPKKQKKMNWTECWFL